MIELQIEGQDKPLDEKREFFLVTDDADGELATLLQIMEEYTEDEGEFAFEQVVRKATDTDGTWKMQMPDDEVAELIEIFESEYPQFGETLAAFQEDMLRRIEEPSGG